MAFVVSKLIVDLNDPAFGNPTKPIGLGYTEADAQLLVSERGWSIVKDGSAWRRAVASPRPIEILGLDLLSFLASRGVLVICVGGGGVPVARASDARLHGIEAVIDKDHACALLACKVNADFLLLLTDVDSVYCGWGTVSARAVASAGLNDLDPTEFEPGSMRPKIEAALEFAQKTGKRAVIGRLEDAAGLIAGSIGTSFDVSQVGLRV